MSSTVYTLSRTSNESLEELEKRFLEEFDKNFIGVEISHDQIEEIENVEVLLLVCERYYFRTGSMATLTLQCVNDGKEQKAVLIGAGGGTGISNISLGANANFANAARDILKKYGFGE